MCVRDMERSLIITGEGLGNIIQSTAAIGAFHDIFRGHMELDVLVHKHQEYVPLVEGEHRILSEPVKEKYTYIIPMWLFREFALRMKTVRRGRTNVISGSNPLYLNISESEAHVRAVRAAAVLHGIALDTAHTPRTWCNYKISDGVEALLDRKGPVVCLHDGGKPGRFWLAKRYPYWQEVHDLVAAEMPDITFLVLGTMKDGTISGKRVVDMRKRLNILNTAGLLRKANLFIGNDSGLAHIAAAQGTTSLIVFGPTNIVKNLPPHNAIPLAEKNGLSCRPCQRKGGRWRTGTDGKRCNLKCFENLKSSVVAGRVLDILRNIRYPHEENT
jgi:hypothetical protein